MTALCKQLNLPPDIQLDLFHKLVLPVLIYGSEVWGYSNLNKVELFYRKFLKSMLRIGKFSANSMAYGETGKTKLENIILNRMVAFWHNSRVGKEGKISAILQKFLKYQFDY